MGSFVQTIGGGCFLGNRLPWAAAIWAAIATLVILMLRRTGFGRVLYGLGDNAGRRCGWPGSGRGRSWCSPTR